MVARKAECPRDARPSARAHQSRSVRRGRTDREAAMSVTGLDHQLALRALANGKAPAVLRDELFVGRGTELALLDRDLDLIEAGGASLRILVGEPGSGKTMLMHAMAERARSRRFVTTAADLDPDSLLHGRGGE